MCRLNYTILTRLAIPHYPPLALLGQGAGPRNLELEVAS